VTQHPPARPIVTAATASQQVSRCRISPTLQKVNLGDSTRRSEYEWTMEKAVLSKGSSSGSTGTIRPTSVTRLRAADCGHELTSEMMTWRGRWRSSRGMHDDDDAVAAHHNDNADDDDHHDAPS
jgi:hypothetical protein